MVHPLSHAGGEWSEQPDFLARKLAAVNWLPFRIDLKIQWNYFRGRKTIIIKKSRDKSEAYDPLKVGPCHPQESKENLVTHSPRRVMFEKNCLSTTASERTSPVRVKKVTISKMFKSPPIVVVAFLLSEKRENFINQEEGFWLSPLVRRLPHIGHSLRSMVLSNYGVRTCVTPPR